ncbi:unnamed protein product, partial [Ectocarpus fasciculatus]
MPHGEESKVDVNIVAPSADAGLGAEANISAAGSATGGSGNIDTSAIKSGEIFASTGGDSSSYAPSSSIDPAAAASVKVEGGEGLPPMNWSASQSGGDASADMPGKPSIAGGSVNTPSMSGGVETPSMSGDAPSMSGGVDVPSMSGGVDAPSMSGGGGVDVPSMSGGATTGLPSSSASGSVDVPGVDANVPEMRDPKAPSAEVAGVGGDLSVGGSMPSVEGGASLPTGKAEGEKGHHVPGSGFLHSIADSMRETAGVQRHDASAPKPSAELPEGGAPTPGKVGKITASLAEATQVVGWGAQGTKPEKKRRPRPEGAEAVAAPAADASIPSVDAPAVDVSAPAVDLSVEGGGGVDAPKVEGGLTLPSAEADVGVSGAASPPTGALSSAKRKSGKFFGGLFGRKNSKFADADVDAGVDVAVPAVEGGVSAEMPTVGGDGTLPSADVSLPSASVDAPSVDVSGGVKGPDAPDVKVEGGSLSGKLTAGAASVGAAALGAIGLYGKSGKADVEVPNVDASVDAPGVSVDAPSIDASVDVPSVTADASLPSASVDVPSAEVDASLPSASVDAPSGGVGASLPSAGDLSADLGAKAPDVPSVDVKKPKKGLFGGLFGSGKTNIEVPDADVSADASLPEVGGSLPGVSGEVSAPDVSGSLSVPSGSVDLPTAEVGGDMPSTSVDVDMPSASVDAPGVKVEGGDASLTAGLAAGGAAALAGVGAAVGLSGDKPDVEVRRRRDYVVWVLCPHTSGEFCWERPLTVSDVPDAGVSVPDVSADVSVPDVSGDVSVPDVSADVSVPDVSGSLKVPSVDMDVPLGSAEAPSVDLAGKMPEMPSVEGGVSGELPSGDVSVTAPDVKVEGGDTSLTAGLAAGGVAAVGAIGAAVGLSGDKPDAELPSGDVDASVSVPDVPSVDVKKPKKGLFGGLFGSSKGKIEVSSCVMMLPSLCSSCQVPDADVSVPEVSADVSAPDVSADVSVPDVSGSLKVPDVSGDVSLPGVSGSVDVPSVDMDAPSGSVEVPSVDLAGKMPSVEGGVGGELPSGDVSVTAPDVKVEGGDTSLTAGLAAGGVAAVGAIGAAVGLSGDKPDAELPSGDVDASVSVPDVPSVDVKKPKKGLFGGLFGSSKGKIEVSAVCSTTGDVSVPDLSGDVSVPDVSADVSVPDVSGSLKVPDVSGDVSVPDVSAGVSVPDVSSSLKVPDVTGNVSLPGVSGS